MKSKFIKFTTIFSIVFLSFQVSTFSQNHNFKPGAIITLNNDTIVGYIDNQKKTLNSVECAFKTSDSSITLYSANELNGYFFNDGYSYIAKTVNASGIDERLFLEYVIDGKINLYKCKYLFEELYFIENEQGIKELKITKVEKYVDNKVLVGKKDRYKGILNWAMSGDSKMEISIAKTKFNIISFAKLVIEYHEKNNLLFYNYNNYSKSKKEINISVGVSAGFLNSNLNISPIYTEGPNIQFFNDDMTLSSFHSQFSNPLNSSTNLPSSFRSKNFSFGFLSSINMGGLLSFETGVNWNKFVSNEIEFNRIFFPFAIRIALSKYKTITPFVQIGVNYNVYSKLEIKENYTLTYSELTGVTPEFLRPIYSQTNRSLEFDFLNIDSSLGFLPALGITIKKKSNNLSFIMSYMTSGFESNEVENIAPYVNSKIQLKDILITLNYSYTF